MNIKSCFRLGCKAVKNKRKYNAILGISVGSREFSKQKIEEYLKFCLEYFENTLVIIVDSIKKYNFMAFQDLSEKEAREKAEFEGAEFFKATQKTVKKLNYKKINVSRIKIVRWKEIVKTVPEYDKILDYLKIAYKQDKEFHSDAIQMTEKYVETRNIKKIDEKKELAVNFLLEELALFLIIGNSTKEKYCIDVYPSKFPIIENILNCKYKDLLQNLPEIKYGHVEIKY